VEEGEKKVHEMLAQDMVEGILKNAIGKAAGCPV
jgi:hypothetical protein